MSRNTKRYNLAFKMFVFAYDDEVSKQYAIAISLLLIGTCINIRSQVFIDLEILKTSLWGEARDDANTTAR